MATNTVVPPPASDRTITPQPSSNPTQGAADTTAGGKKPGWAEIEGMIEERLAKNGEYSKLGADIIRTNELGNDMQTLLSHGALGWDHTLTRGEIQDMANYGPPAVKAAAKRLLANHELLNKLMNGNDAMTMGDVTRVVEEMRGRQSAIRETTNAQVRADVDAAPPVGTSRDAVTGDQTPPAPDGNANPQPAPGSDIPKPPPSTKPGIDGALENLGNSADHLQKQMEAVANDPKMDPGLKASTMASLQAKQTSVMNMLNQLSQMMSNTAKLWSDIAMNSVRNIK